MIFPPRQSNAGASTGRSPFLRIYFRIQSYLQDFAPAPPYHVKRKRQVFRLYAGLVTALTIAVYAAPAGAKAALLGMMIPGTGFLHWAAGDQFTVAIVLSLAGMGFFAAALILWLATGNVIAPLMSWIGLAAASAAPDLLMLDDARVAPGWQFALAPLAVTGLGIAMLRPIKTPRVDGALSVIPVEEKAVTVAELSLEELHRVRLLLDRALQPASRFDGFEWLDQFQSAALRYQVNFVAYALALTRHRFAPAADAYFLEAQQNLLAKIGDRRLWSYWRLENAWGNLRLDADPIPNQNIMYPGFAALQMAIGGANGDLALHDKGHIWRRYDLKEITQRLAQQYEASAYGLLTCEPNWIYPLCNLITMAGLKAADAHTGAGHWPRLAEAFLHSLNREGTKADGSLVAFRSALTGIAPPAAGGIIMQAFPCLFLNSLAPHLAQEHWRRIRATLDKENWRRLFWPVDIGNYGFSRATSYAATGAAAMELGDIEIANECLARLETECPSHPDRGVIHRARASLWAHALEIALRCNRRNGLRDLVAQPRTSDGPRLVRAAYPDVLIARAEARGDSLHLVLHPGAGTCVTRIEMSGLMPERCYRTGHESEPLLKADGAGNAVLHVTLQDRTALTIEPLA